MVKICILFFLFCLAQACQPIEKSESSYTLFSDSFDRESEGELQKNIIQLPPPQGLGYTYKVLEGGKQPVNWIWSDELTKNDPKKGFWVIPPDSGYLEQGGRSHNSVLFAKTPIPVEAQKFSVRFRQFRNDNDPITYILGAEEPVWNQGFEIGYMTQVPGTDSTTNHAYIMGDLGEKVVENMAFNHQWVDHLIKVDHDTISWYVNDQLMIKNQAMQPVSGYFGIRHRYERGTRYDDVAIEIYD